MKIFPFFILTVLIFIGCVPRQPNPAVVAEIQQQGAFLRFIDAETTTERAQALKSLQRDFPQSPLTTRAIELDKLAAARLEQQAKIKQLTKEMKRCNDEKSLKETDNAALRQDMEQLKQLVIEMEMRAR